jgi:cupin domain
MRRIVVEVDGQGLPFGREVAEPETARVVMARQDSTDVPTWEHDPEVVDLPKELGVEESGGPGSQELLVTKVFTGSDVPSLSELSVQLGPEYSDPWKGADLVWQVTHFGPNVDTGMHIAPGLLYGYFVSGEMTLAFETSEVHLSSGDSLVLPTGLKHAWRTGDSPCLRVAAVLVPK